MERRVEVEEMEKIVEEMEKIVEEMEIRINVEEMDKELYKAAVEGDKNILEDEGGRGRNDDYYQRRTSENNNIIHIAVRHEEREFVEEALNSENFPREHCGKLISERNSKGNTPLHIAAEIGNLKMANLLFHRHLKFCGDAIKPLRVPNISGDTPLHVALLHDNVEQAQLMLEKDPCVVRFLNVFTKEAPLHLAIKQHVNLSESKSIIEKIQQQILDGGAELNVKSAPEKNMSSMIEYLLEKESCVACWPDKDGMTPLLKAASLHTPYDLKTTKLIIKHCPQSADVFDPSGKSILHLLLKKKIPSYQDGKDLLAVKEIYALRNLRDHHGNTPLHVAVKNEDTIMVRVLLESSPKLNINNCEGTCAMSVIQQNNLLQMLRQRTMTEDESDAADNADIQHLSDRFAKLDIDLLLSKDFKGKNILHKLMRIKDEVRINEDDFVDFVEKIVKKYAELVYQTDYKGDTPVHVLVRNTDASIYIDRKNPQHTSVVTICSLWHSGLLSRLLKICNESIKKRQQQPNNSAHNRVLPWLVQNAKGNTPLHEAVIATNKTMVLTVLECSRQSAGLVNKLKETPLHLLAKTLPNKEPFDRNDIDMIVKANEEAAKWLDEEGLTPILRAFKARNLVTATTLCRVCPEAAKINDTDGQIFWHLLIREQSSSYLVYGLLQDEKLRGQLSAQDKKGDTMLHLAIRHKRFDIIQAFLDTLTLVRKSEREKGGNELSSKHKCWWLRNCLGIPNTERDRKTSLNDDPHQKMVKLFKIQNKNGKTPGDLIAALKSLPPEIERGIKDRYEMVGLRSVWGIPSTETKTYVNTMGIIAALLATMTFTAAFTVPGGLYEDIGTPIMIHQASFQVFIIFDVIAMSLSMVVLFFLLKIMATKDRRNSVVILDLCIALTLMSFCATLVTFMTGLFAAMFSVKRWIAIVTVVLCSSITVFVIQFLFNKLRVPFKQAIIYFDWMVGRKTVQHAETSHLPAV